MIGSPGRQTDTVDTVERTQEQEWVLEQLEWHGTGEGHDARCWRRHPACAEAYVRQLQVAVMALDSDLRRLLNGYDFDNLVKAEVERRVAAIEPKVVERKVEVVRHDPKEAAIVSAVAEWLDATEKAEELAGLYGADDEDAVYFEEMPDDLVSAQRDQKDALEFLRKTAERYFR